MRGVRGRHRPVAEINVVPYIDVMLVLLVIFMITTPLLTQGVKVDLPRSRAQTIAPKSTMPIILSVDKKGNYYLNTADKPRQAMNPQAVATRVAAELALDKRRGQSRDVLVRGDSGAPYGEVVRAMALLQQVGVEHVGMLTEPMERRT